MVKVNGPSADRAAHRPMVSIRRTQVKERRSDRRQFRRTKTAGAICVRTVRSGPGIVFQGVGADGRSVAIAATVRIAGYRPHGLSREAVGRIGFRRGRGRCGRLRPRLFWRGRQADGTGPGSAFAPECYLDADLAQEVCRPAQPAREGTPRVRPTLALSLRSPDLLGKAAQKFRTRFPSTLSAWSYSGIRRVAAKVRAWLAGRQKKDGNEKLPVLPVPVIEIARRKENETMQVDDAPAVTPTDLDRSCARMLHAQARLLRPCQSGPRHEGAVQEFLAGVSLKRDGQAQRVHTRLRSGPAVVSGPCRGALFGL